MYSHKIFGMVWRWLESLHITYKYCHNRMYKLYAQSKISILKVYLQKPHMGYKRPKPATSSDAPQQESKKKCTRKAAFVQQTEPKLPSGNAIQTKIPNTVQRLVNRSSRKTMMKDQP